jgi:two-component system, cell cycle response regulator DivK
MYAAHLKYEGFHVESAADGREGLKKAHALRPDVIVLDLSMPLIDGWTLCQTLKRTPLTQRIPVIVLSGFADEKSRERAQAAGVDIFLSKPCLPEDLAQEIQRRVTTSRLSATSNRQTR